MTQEKFRRANEIDNEIKKIEHNLSILEKMTGIEITRPGSGCNNSFYVDDSSPVFFQKIKEIVIQEQLKELGTLRNQFAKL